MAIPQVAIDSKSSRLILREVQEVDWQFVQSINFSSNLQTEVDCRRYIRQFLTQQSQNPRKQYRFMIIVKQSDRPIGWCDLWLEAGGGAEIGYRIDATNWGQGFATEAAELVIRFAFLKSQVDYVWAETKLQNPASMRVLEKVGMQRQPAQNTDVIYYRLERQAWQWMQLDESFWRDRLI